ncbi:hypothetical protein RP20_CCG006937 [Aedes albopictus]|nr:hypothetical protein RP20_CCG006937 [Aedes albopictus]
MLRKQTRRSERETQNRGKSSKKPLVLTRRQRRRRKWRNEESAVGTGQRRTMSSDRVERDLRDSAGA